MTTTIAVNGLSEEEFRRAIERKVRHGKAAEAREQLRTLLTPYAGPVGILPARFLTVTAADLTLTGWEVLGLAIARHDEPYRRITALSIAFGWEGEDVPQPDDQGRLKPYLETSYFTDDAFPFSQSARADLLEGYSYHGCTWAGDCEATDTALGLDGIDDLRGALALLEARLLATDYPEEEEIRAGSLGACLLSVLLFEAVDARIAADGLPRRLCVMAGCNDVYPYFDAPVVGIPEEVSPEQAVIDAGIPAPRYSSLLMTGVPRGRKRAVLVLEETADEAANRIARLRGHPAAEPQDAPVPDVQPEAATAPVPEGTIIPLPGGPLMTKKPHGPGWDFRDMLSPRPPGLQPAGSAPPDLSQDESGRSGSEESEIEASRHAGNPELAEPGFSLFETRLENHIQLLVGTPAPPASQMLTPDCGLTVKAIHAGLPVDSTEIEGSEPQTPADPLLTMPLTAVKPLPFWARLKAWFGR